jgi:hypothetical protein
MMTWGKARACALLCFAEAHAQADAEVMALLIDAGMSARLARAELNRQIDASSAEMRAAPDRLTGLFLDPEAPGALQ